MKNVYAEAHALIIRAAEVLVNELPDNPIAKALIEDIRTFTRRAPEPNTPTGINERIAISLETIAEVLADGAIDTRTSIEGTVVARMHQPPRDGIHADCDLAEDKVRDLVRLAGEDRLVTEAIDFAANVLKATAEGSEIEPIAHAFAEKRNKQ